MSRVRRVVRVVALAVVMSFALLSPVSAQIGLLPDQPMEGWLLGQQQTFVFWLPAGATATVSLSSVEFDAYLIVLDPDRTIVAQDDDSGPGTDAVVTWTVSRDGWYTAVVTSFAGAGSGAYTVGLTLGSAMPGVDEASGGADSEAVGELVFGVPVEGTIGERHAESGVVYTLAGWAGDAVSIELASDSFDAHLRLLDPDGVEIASNDDAGGSLDSQIVLRLPATGAYSVVAGPLYYGTGDYTLRADVLPELHVAHGSLSELDEIDGEIFHEYVWYARQGAVGHIWLQGEFDGYLEVYDEWGDLVAEDDDSGGFLNARVALGPVDEGRFYVRVTSVGGRQTGEYALYVWSHAGEGEPGSARPLAPLGAFDAEISSEGFARSGPEYLELGEMIQSEVLFAGDARSFIVELPGAGAYDAWLFAEIDLELYGDVADASDGLLASYGSESPEGYEHIRIEAPPGAERLYLEVSPYDDPGAGVNFWLLVEEVPVGEEASEARPCWEAVPGVAAELPLGGRIQPGVRYSGVIDDTRFETQFWVLEVPEGVERVHVGLFEADGDMDVSIAPGWSPSWLGLAHDAFSVTVRDNERISIGGPDDWIADVAPGVYTIAVWPGLPGGTSYELEVSFDEPLPPSSTYVPLDPETLASLSPIQRAQVASVRVHNDVYGSGSGTIVTSDGLILTNYHVVAPCDVAPNYNMGCVGGARIDEINQTEQIVSLTDRMKGYAKQYFVAEVVRVLPEYDLALLQIVRDVDGNAVRDLSLPALPIDVREAGAVLGEEVIALGYSTIARLGPRSPLSLTRGVVSGFTTYKDQRVFLQIDAEIAAGNSGGSLVRLADGVLIGVPSDRVFSETSVEAQNFARPASLVPREWVDLIVSRGGRVIE